jgi:hypothetical protein
LFFLYSLSSYLNLHFVVIVYVLYVNFTQYALKVSTLLLGASVKKCTNFPYFTQGRLRGVHHHNATGIKIYKFAITIMKVFPNLANNFMNKFPKALKDKTAKNSYPLRLVKIW